jgi:hypothetical protein
VFHPDVVVLLESVGYLSGNSDDGVLHACAVGVPHAQHNKSMVAGRRAGARVGPAVKRRRAAGFTVRRTRTGVASCGGFGAGALANSLFTIHSASRGQASINAGAAVYFRRRICLAPGEVGIRRPSLARPFRRMRAHRRGDGHIGSVNTLPFGPGFSERAHLAGHKPAIFTSSGIAVTRTSPIRWVLFVCKGAQTIRYREKSGRQRASASSPMHVPRFVRTTAYAPVWQ